MSARPGKGAFQWPYTLSPYDAGMLIEDAWPTLFFGVERLQEIRRKGERLPWAADAIADMRREADAVLQGPPPLPAERIGWRHDFYSHKKFRRGGRRLQATREAPSSFLFGLTFPKGCSRCGYVDAGNRNRHDFTCKACGYRLHADLNASRNVRLRGILARQALCQDGSPSIDPEAPPVDSGPETGRGEGQAAPFRER